MEDSKGKKIIELINKVETLEGTKIIHMTQALAVSQYTLNKNYEELKNSITTYENDLSIWDMGRRRNLEAFLVEFSRLFHNYLSSIFSLIEHTRTFLNNLNNPQLRQEYYEKLENLKINECVKFLKDLRTYVQHCNLSIVSAEFTLKRKNNDIKNPLEHKQNLVIGKKELLKWGGWSFKSKNYIDKLENNVDLDIITIEYQKLITEFYQWFYNIIGELYSDKIKEVLEIEKEIMKLEEQDDIKSS